MKNSVTVKDEKVSEMKRDETAFHMERAGRATAPHGNRYLGHACVFFYEDSMNALGLRLEYTLATSVRLRGIPEKFADVGFKKLLEKMMQQYGRKQTKMLGQKENELEI